MTNTNYSQFDLEFASTFDWNCPKDKVDEALKILFSEDGLNDDLQSVGMPGLTAMHMKCRLASHPDAPHPVLEHLSNCRESKVLERIAGHSNISEATLAKLAESQNPEVRAAVAENSKANDTLISKLIADENMDVRFRLAENPHLAEHYLLRLSEDENPYVAHRAQKTLSRVRSTDSAVHRFPARESRTTKRDTLAM